jgi:hypothetical protein
MSASVPQEFLIRLPAPLLSPALVYKGLLAAYSLGPGLPLGLRLHYAKVSGLGEGDPLHEALLYPVALRDFLQKRFYYAYLTHYLSSYFSWFLSYPSWWPAF